MPYPHEIDAARIRAATLHHLLKAVLVEGNLATAFGDGQRLGIHNVLKHFVLANGVQVVLHFTKQV